MKKSDLTLEQLNAVAEKFKQHPDGAKSFDEFFREMHPGNMRPRRYAPMVRYDRWN